MQKTRIRFSPQKRKAFGFHVLEDPQVIASIVEEAFRFAQASTIDEFLEIGPGLGALTFPLLENLPKGSLTLVEKNRELAGNLLEEIQKSPSKSQVRLMVEDFLKVPVSDWSQTKTPIIVVSNLPYSASTAILDRLTEGMSQIEVMVLMFQKEVADRLNSMPGTSKRGSLSVFQQNLWEIYSLLVVPPSAFSPPPQVNSEVLVFKRRSKPLVLGSTDGSGKNQDLWQDLLKRAFGSKRKMLRNNLSSSPEWKKALEISGVDPTLRAEALEWQDWQKLFSSRLS